MPKCFVAQEVAAARRQIVDAVAFEVDLAGVGRVERAEQVQQRALAGAALADDRQELAAADSSRSTPCSTGISMRAFAIALAQVHSGEVNRGFDERRLTETLINVHLRAARRAT